MKPVKNLYNDDVDYQNYHTIEICSRYDDEVAIILAKVDNKTVMCMRDKRISRRNRLPIVKFSQKLKATSET